MSTDRAPHSLDPLLRPRSVAVLGAGRKRGSLGGEVFHNLVSSGFAGPVFPVNPTAPYVQSVRAYASVTDIPDPVDLAVLVVPAAEVLGAVDACARKGVRALVVITAGFAETGPAGKALQDELTRRVRAAGMRLVGPNCLGIMNRDPAVALNATFAPVWPAFGGVAIASQSGALGQAILEYGRERGIGISQFVAIGNKADVSGNDLLDYWELDPATKMVLLYLESFGNPRRFMQIARRVGRRRPVAMVKSGRTEAGARAASSHTGALAGADVAVEALLGQAGVIRTDTIEELFDVAMILANQPVPKGARVGILTNAGGPGIMASDACASRGLEVAALSEPTETGLRAFLPPEASVRNPVDMIASASAASYGKALRLMLADPGLDSLIVLFVPPVVTDASDVATAIREAAAGSHKPIVTCFMGKHGVADAVPALRDAGIPSYAFPESAAIALARVTRYGAWLQKPEGTVPELSAATLARVQEVLARGQGERWLGPADVRDVLEAIGVRVPGAAEARTADEAAGVADRLGYPVVLKLEAEGVTHKSDVGGVLLGLADADAVRAGFDTIARRAAEKGLAKAFRGVQVQAMAPRALETFVGVVQDPAFGPLVGFGLGGVHVEVLRDVVFRVSPVTDVDAREMVGQIRGRALLDGVRGAPPADREAIAEVIARVGRLVDAFPAIQELDLNPLLALPPGQGVLAVDGRIRVRA